MNTRPWSDRCRFPLLAVLEATLTPEGGNAQDISEAVILGEEGLTYSADVDSGVYVAVIRLGRGPAERA